LKGDVHGFAAFGFVKMKGEGGAACHHVAAEGILINGGRAAACCVLHFPDDDRAVVAVRFGFVRLSFYPEVNGYFPLGADV
jgi:hypothetical protein